MLVVFLSTAMAISTLGSRLRLEKAVLVADVAHMLSRSSGALVSFLKL